MSALGHVEREEELKAEIEKLWSRVRELENNSPAKAARDEIEKLQKDNEQLRAGVNCHLQALEALVQERDQMRVLIEALRAERNAALSPVRMREKSSSSGEANCEAGWVTKENE